MVEFYTFSPTEITDNSFVARDCKLSCWWEDGRMTVEGVIGMRFESGTKLTLLSIISLGWGEEGHGYCYQLSYIFKRSPKTSIQEIFPTWAVSQYKWRFKEVCLFN